MSKDGPWTFERVDRLIRDQTQERTDLEFKAGEVLQILKDIPDKDKKGRQRQLTKEVAAMANADGGTIIIGVAERGQKAHKWSPPDLGFSVGQLEDWIHLVQPRVDYDVDLVEDAGDAGLRAFVISVRKGDTAHAASDRNFYKRFGSQAVHMEPYEVKDVMNRTKHPKVAVEMDGPEMVTAGPHGYGHRAAKVSFCLVNEGVVAAKHYKAYIQFPDAVLGYRIAFGGPPIHRGIPFDNDLPRVQGLPRYGTIEDQGKRAFPIHFCSTHINLAESSRVLFPQFRSLQVEFKFQQLDTRGAEVEGPPEPLRFICYADGMAPQKGQIQIPAFW